MFNFSITFIVFVSECKKIIILFCFVFGLVLIISVVIVLHLVVRIFLI